MPDLDLSETRVLIEDGGLVLHVQYGPTHYERIPFAGGASLDFLIDMARRAQVDSATEGL